MKTQYMIAMGAFITLGNTAPSFGMEPEKKTVIRGQLELIHNNDANHAYYTGSNYHNEISSIFNINPKDNDLFVPICLLIEDADQTTNWTKAIPSKIAELEIARRKAKKGTTGLVDWTLNKLTQKRFPAHILATDLYMQETGSFVYFYAYGYTIEAKCIDNLDSDMTFKDQFNNLMKNFNTKPYYITYKQLDPHAELLEKEIISINEDGETLCGPNKFPGLREQILDKTIFNSPKSRERTGSFKKK